MRNRYPGTCYRCGEHVAVGQGHFERHNGGWRTQHASCAIFARQERARAATHPAQSNDARGETL